MAGALIDNLRHGAFGTATGHVHLPPDYSVPWYIGTPSDPLWTVAKADGSLTRRIRIPASAVSEAPFGIGSDSSIGGADSTQPYLVWSATGTTLSGTTIICNVLQIDDGAGNVMCDQVTGQPGSNNSLGAGIQDYELTRLNADASYVIPHMLAYELDAMQMANSLVWPLLIADMSFQNTGLVPQGSTIAIPRTTVRPTGKTRGWYTLFDSLQHFGWLHYNQSGNGCLSIGCYPTSPANMALADDIAASLSDVLNYVGILTNQSGESTMKGAAPGGVDAFPAPAPLDLSPTGGVNVAPSSFGAWYPSGYNVVP